MMKLNKKAVLPIVLSIAILVLLIIVRIKLSYSYSNTAYDIRFNRQAPVSERVLILYRDSLGYFPPSIDEAVSFAHKYYYPDVSEEEVRARQQFEDLFAKSGGEISYIPLFDYRTKTPTSFIFLSAGIDGKMNNIISPSDTLYINTWWAELDVYNYGEAILVKDQWEKTYDNWSLFDEEEYKKYYPPYPALEPRFSMMKYLFGKKDWIIQIGLTDNSSR